MKKFILLLFIYVVSDSLVKAQPVLLEDADKKAQKSFNEGVEHAMHAEFTEALASFQKAIAEEPNLVNAYNYAGNACYELQMDSLAVYYFLTAIELKPDFDVGIYKRLAESEQNIMHYEDSEKHIRIFLDNPKIAGVTRSNAEHLLKSVQFAKEAIKHPVDFNPVNLGAGINSEYAEYFPSVSADNEELIFTRKIPQTGTVNANAGETKLQEDFFATTKSDGAWGPAVNVGQPVNTKLNEGAQNISADGRYLFYTLCNSPEGFGSCDIYYALKIGDVWSYPENCGRKINGGDWESQPSISADGKFLYFCSTRPGGLGGYDIWAAQSNGDGTWQKPFNLGAPVNTPFDEQSPFMHPDGRTIYFSSNGHPNMGGNDLFYSRMDAQGNWQQPVNLGYPINTNKNEITLTVSADGKTAYYASDRSDSYGGLDLYQFTLPEILRPDPVTYVKATVRDSKTKQPVRSFIQLIDIESGDTLATSVSDKENGEFLVCLPIGKKYALFISKEGYLFHSENFSLEKAIPDEPYRIDIDLQPVEIGQLITLRNIFFETGSASLLPESQAELNRVIELLSRNPEMKIRINGHTDNVGSDAENMQLSDARSKSVKDFLVTHGIASDRLETKGYGESKPVSTNDTDSGRAQNRRTEIEITAR